MGFLTAPYLYTGAGVGAGVLVSFFSRTIA
jgi:hypothetical protein